MAGAEEEWAAARGRRKVRLGAGFSQMDWMRLAQKLKGGGGGAELTLEEVEEHNALGHDAWMVVRGIVYDVTKYAPYHPGGVEELARGVGVDATALFDEYHPWVSISMIDKLKVGKLVPSAGVGARLRDAPKPASSPSSKGGAGILSRITRTSKAKSGGAAAAAAASDATVDGWRPCSVERLAESPSRFCVLARISSSFSEEDEEALRQPGTFIKLRKRIDDKIIERPFTPFLNLHTETDHTVWSLEGLPERPNHGAVDLFAKVYKDGLITKVLAGELAPGGLQIQVCRSVFTMRLDRTHGPIVEMRGAAAFRRASSGDIQHLCLIAAGTGIMPMIQVLDLLSTRGRQDGQQQEPTVSVLWANNSALDVPFSTAFAKLRETTSLVAVDHVWSQAQQDSGASSKFSGRINADVIKAHVAQVYPGKPAAESAAAPKIRFLVCGSFEFNTAVEDALANLLWPSETVVRID